DLLSVALTAMQVARRATDCMHHAHYRDCPNCRSQHRRQETNQPDFLAGRFRLQPQVAGNAETQYGKQCQRQGKPAHWRSHPWLDRRGKYRNARSDFCRSSIPFLNSRSSVVITVVYASLRSNFSTTSRTLLCPAVQRTSMTRISSGPSTGG